MVHLARAGPGHASTAVGTTGGGTARARRRKPRSQGGTGMPGPSWASSWRRRSRRATAGRSASRICRWGMASSTAARRAPSAG
eukprot:2577227-Alexandrium_andersonii.AAC.1